MSMNNIIVVELTRNCTGLRVSIVDNLSSSFYFFVVIWEASLKKWTYSREGGLDIRMGDTFKTRSILCEGVL